MFSVVVVIDVFFEQDVFQSDVLVFVDFWVFWCGFCWMVVFIVEEIVKEFDGQIKVFKFNIDENFNVVSQYGICSILILMVFKGGQKVDIVVGVVLKVILLGIIFKYF